MAAPIVVDAPWAHGKCETFRLYSDGLFHGYMHPSGKALQKNMHTEVDPASCMFLTCRNRGDPLYSICAISKTPFELIPPSQYFPAIFAVMIGITETKGLFQYHYLQWKGHPNAFQIIVKGMKPLHFIKKFFSSTIMESQVGTVHLRFLNQLSGPSLVPHWTPTIALRNAILYHEMAMAPDRWVRRWIKTKHKEMKLINAHHHSPLNISSVAYTPIKNQSSCFSRWSKLLTFPRTNTLVTYHHYSKRDHLLGSYFFIPLPLSPNGCQDFAMLHQQEKDQLDKFFAEMVVGGSLNSNEFRAEVEDLVDSSCSEIVSFPKLTCGGTYFGEKVTNFINVIVDTTFDPATIGAVSMGTNMWALMLDENVIDIDVPGCGINAHGNVVGRFSLFPKHDSLSDPQKRLLVKSVPSAGLHRFRTKHYGSFVMCSIRQSDMSSCSMAMVSSPSNHFYWDQSKLDTSLINFTFPITNALACQAISTRDAIGQISMGVARKTALEFDNKFVNSTSLCPHVILTFPKKCKKLHSWVSFANTEHVDADSVSIKKGNAIWKYISDCNSQCVKDYFAATKRIFHNNEEFDSTFQFPITCVWTPLRDPSVRKNIEHVQHFVIPNAGVCWDLSSKAFNENIQSVTGTFFGGLVSHVTSCAIWVDHSNGNISTISRKMNANLAWGSNPKK